MPARPKTPHLFVVEDRGYATPCHVWTRAKGSHGYGSIKVDGVVLLAHRRFYELAKGPIPAGAHLDHLCRVPLCVNAEHLEAVTQAENVRRGTATKLAPTQVEEIRTRRRAGETTVALAAEFDIRPCSVSKIDLGMTWAA